MEEAPQGTFQDELEWCISQLETGLLRLNPTPEQVEDSRYILRVLRSRKAPVVKKRQVMHQVFGDYRLKMTEDLKRAAKAVVMSEKVGIQPGNAFPLGSVVVYRKQSSQPSKSSSWFTPSDSNFQFRLDHPERTPEEINRTACEVNGADEANGADSSQEQTAGDVIPTLEGQRKTFHFSTGTQRPKFAFNFVIPERLPPPSTAAVWSFGPPGWKVEAEAATESDTSSREATEIPEDLVSPKPDRLDATSGTCQRDDGSPSLEVAREVVNSEKVGIQLGDAFPLGSVVVCRKRSDQPSRSSSWFTPSDSSFQFRLDRPERTSEEINRTTDEGNGADSSQEQTAGDVPSTLEGQREMFQFSTGTQGPKFAFNFAIPEHLPPPSASAVWSFGPPGWKVAAEAATESDTPSREATEIPESLVSPKTDRLDATSGTCQRDDGSPSLEVAREEKKATPLKETSAAAASRSSKRKKRKKQPSKVEPNQNVNEDNRLHVKATCDQTEMCQQSDEQLKREVDWCVEQLELGLKTQKPTPKQVVKSEGVEVQPGDAFPLGSVMVYRKQSSQPSKSSSWFTPSDSSFQFRLDRPERTPEEINRTTDEANRADSSQEQTAGDVPPTLEGQREMFQFSTGTQGPKFAFNFVIPEHLPPPSTAAVWRFEPPGWKVEAEAATESDTSSRAATEIPESLVSPKPDRLDATSSRCQRDDGSLALEVAREEKKEAPQKERTASRSSKRKKRKKQPSKVEPNQNVNKDNRLHVKATCDQTEMCQQSDEQLKREVDWCVEQLELGLKTQKPTPKQVDEMLRAIKTLRSEKAVLAKKRQMMRFMFGDYRKKMAEDRQKQLKLMQTASKAARITEVTEDARRTSSQVFRKSVEVAGRRQNPKDPLLSPENPQQPDPLLSFPRGADFCPFTFTPSREKFRFNFF